MRLDLRTAIRLAVRGVRRDAATSIVTALTLALGIGASTTLLGLVTGATRPLPVPEGHRIARIDLVLPEGGAPDAITAEDLRQWREAAATVELAGTTRIFDAVLSGVNGFAGRHSAAALSTEVLPLLRVGPALGRFPEAGEAAVVISWDLWRELYHGDASIIGAEVRLDGLARTLVGVMPAGFRFPLGQDIWVAEADDPPAAEVEIVARLALEFEVEQATDELQALWQGADPQRAAGPVAHVRVQPFTGGRGESGEAVAFAAVGSIVLALLVVSCINGSTLLLLRASRRGHVAGVQRALGASRGQVGTQLLLEAVLIALAGGAGGLGITWLAVQWVDRVFSVHFGYYWMRMAIDGPVLAATALLVTGAAILAGAMPAWRAMHADPAVVLRSGARTRGVGRAGSAFLTLQIGAATAALVGAALLGSGLGRWSSWAAFLPDEPLVVATIDLIGTRHQQGAAAIELRRRLLEQMAPTPATMALGLPGYGEPRVEVDIEDDSDDAPLRRTQWNAVTPGFLEQFGVRAVAGRALDATDTSASEPVAVVSESFVAQFLPDRDPLRARVRLADGDWLTVVGVASDLDVAGNGSFTERVYRPLAQVEAPRATIVVAGGADPAATVARLREAVAGLDPDLPLDNVNTVQELFAWLTRVPRTISTVGIGGALAGLLTALVGLFGLLAFDVRQRTFEIGVRMAVGADARHILAIVLRRAITMVVPGVLLGLAAMYLLAPLFGLFLMGSDPRAPLPFVAVGAVMLAVGALAALLPARQAMRVPPAVVLRAQ